MVGEIDNNIVIEWLFICFCVIVVGCESEVLIGFFLGDFG